MQEDWESLQTVLKTVMCIRQWIVYVLKKMNTVWTYRNMSDCVLLKHLNGYSKLPEGVNLSSKGLLCQQKCVPLW